MTWCTECGYAPPYDDPKKGWGHYKEFQLCPACNKRYCKKIDKQKRHAKKMRERSRKLDPKLVQFIFSEGFVKGCNICDASKELDRRDFINKRFHNAFKRYQTNGGTASEKDAEIGKFDKEFDYKNPEIHLLKRLRKCARCVNLHEKDGKNFCFAHDDFHRNFILKEWKKGNYGCMKQDYIFW